MESTIDLILKGHFDTLRERINTDKLTEENITEFHEVMNEVIAFLKGKTDKKATALRGRLLEILPKLRDADKQELVSLGTKPMQKAGKRNKTTEKKKAM